METIKIYKEFLKTKIIYFIKNRIGRLNTPMGLVLLSLETYKILPKPMIALELFGGFGLYHVIDYLPYTDYLELWEINPIYAKFAKKFLPKAIVNTGDSIEALKKGKLLKKDYNFIILDSPVEEFGSGHCENFDLFPEIFDYIREKGVLIVTVAHDLKKYRNYRGIKEKISDNWIEKRRKFFGLSSDEDVFEIETERLLDTYKKKAIDNFKKVNAFLIPRNYAISYVVLYLER